MPNYVTNILNVKGSSVDLIRFINRHMPQGYFDFNTIIPEPKYKAETPSRYILPKSRYNKKMFYDGPEWLDWYNWRVKYWGTKWNALHNDPVYFDVEKILEENIQYIDIVFETAWQPAIPVAKKLIETHKKLIISLDYVSRESLIAGHISKDDYGDGNIPGYYYDTYQLR